MKRLVLWSSGCFLAIVVGVTALLALSGGFSKGSFFEHFRRVARVTTMMQEFSKEDWRQLYEECVVVQSNNVASSGTFTSEQWPPMIRKLNPHVAQVDDNTVYMSWTGGFDDFNLWLWVLLKEGTLWGFGEQYAAGIWILDSRKQNEPYSVFLAPSHAQKNRQRDHDSKFYFTEKGGSP